MKKLAILLWCLLLISLSGKIGWIIAGVSLLVFVIVYVVAIIKDDMEIKEWTKDLK